MAEMKGKTFRLERKSRVRKLFDLECVIEIKDDRLYETSTVYAAEAVPLKMLYHFMHAWKPSVSAYAAGIDAQPDKIIAGPLTDATDTVRKFYITQRVDWMAVHEPESGQFAVSRLLEAPELGKHVTMLWNVPGAYRKFYLMCFSKETVPAGFTGAWKMVTAFGAAGTETWESQARKVAKELR
ncbi:hypothetical protein BGE01nite_05420 [Brevifollis gellanilyticus]|uniref:Uncharacterized protein n=2 Tax=Brevifollis gellanilyticus TaxID=748831 RepID=A0A512M4J3_9BACT|nr:hypothetical protein BGE01nite_05420 [Brevifollis gellanilyticus]